MKAMRYCIIAMLSLTVWAGCSGELDKKMDIVSMSQLVEAGKLIEAKAEVITYLTQEEDNEYAWTLLGHIREELEEDSLAESAYSKALAINPDFVQAITGMGILARKSGDYKESEKYYSKAIEIDPSYAEAYASLLVIKIKQEKFQEGVDIGVKAYELDKTNPVIAANLCIAYHYNGEPENTQKFKKIAARNGYPNVEKLDQIITGEFTVLD